MSALNAAARSGGQHAEEGLDRAEDLGHQIPHLVGRLERPWRVVRGDLQLEERPQQLLAVLGLTPLERDAGTWRGRRGVLADDPEEVVDAALGLGPGGHGQSAAGAAPVRAPTPHAAWSGAKIAPIDDVTMSTLTSP